MKHCLQRAGDIFSYPNLIFLTLLIFHALFQLDHKYNAFRKNNKLTNLD